MGLVDKKERESKEDKRCKKINIKFWYAERCRPGGGVVVNFFSV